MAARTRRSGRRILMALPPQLVLGFFGLVTAGVIWGTLNNGWNAMARVYPMNRRFPKKAVVGVPGDAFNKHNARAAFRKGGTRWVVPMKAAADSEGLYFSPLQMGRLFYKPVFIPWSDVDAKEKHHVALFELVTKLAGRKIGLWTLSLKKEPKLQIELYSDVVAMLKEQSGGAWK